jgi:hypothetical protein
VATVPRGSDEALLSAVSPFPGALTAIEVMPPGYRVSVARTRGIRDPVVTGPDMKRPPTHPAELACPCCLPALGD